jgi:SAM-dependent methyltransferase
MGSRSRHWRWYVSAHFYEPTYMRIGHQLDSELFAYLGDRTRGAVVADCGCGPGVVTEKLLGQGAARVFAIDVNPAMLGKLRARLPEAIASGRVVVVQRAFDARFLSDLTGRFLEGGGFDLILFKRSLYLRTELALPILKAALAALAPGGALVMVHPERSLRRYAFGPGWRPMRHTFYHLFNRAFSRVGDLVRSSDYTLYTREELLDLLRTAAAGRPVELIPSGQRAYNMVAVWN